MYAFFSYDRDDRQPKNIKTPIKAITTTEV